MAGHPKHMLLAVDGSDHATLALHFACEKLVEPGDTLTLAHVRPREEETSFLAPATYQVEMRESQRRESEELLGKMTHVAHSLLPESVQVKAVSLSGDPSHELYEAASRIKPTLLVLGSHGKGLLKRALLGSVSRALVHSAPCPVAIVKGTSGASLIPGMEKLSHIVGSAG